MIDLNFKRIVVSRTDSIGDVMLTLPLCAWIKQQFPNATVLFLGKTYTEPIIRAFDAIDGFLNWSEIENQPKSIKQQLVREWQADVIIHVFPRKEIAQLAKSAKIPIRVGTSHRNYHLLTCSHRVNFTRKRSNLHESQLNFNLLKPFGLDEIPGIEDVSKETKHFKAPNIELPETFKSLDNYVILHPKSQGSAVEWPIEKYVELGRQIQQKGFTTVFTGTEKEGELFRSQLNGLSFVDATGKLTLDQLMVLISGASGFVACSTGPLHIAGFLGVRVVGLFAPRRPIHPGRWKPLGSNAVTIVNDPECEMCKKGKPCDCITKIESKRVLEMLKLD